MGRDNEKHGNVEFPAFKQESEMFVVEMHKNPKEGLCISTFFVAAVIYRLTNVHIRNIMKMKYGTGSIYRFP